MSGSPGNEPFPAFSGLLVCFHCRASALESGGESNLGALGDPDLCWLLPGAPLSRLVIWGLLLCTGFRSPWGPRARAMSPYSLSPWPLWPPCLVPSASLSQSHLWLHVQGMYMHASHFGPFPLCFFRTRGPGGDVTWWVWPRDLKGSPWLSQWCGIPPVTPPFLFAGAEGLHPVRAPTTLDHPHL